MLIGDELIMPMLCKVDHMQNMKHEDAKREAPLWTLMGGEQRMANVTNQRQEMLTYLVRMKGMVEAKYMGWE